MREECKNQQLTTATDTLAGQRVCDYDGNADSDDEEPAMVVATR